MFAVWRSPSDRKPNGGATTVVFYSFKVRARLISIYLCRYTQQSAGCEVGTKRNEIELTAQSPAMLPRHQAHCSRRSGLWWRRFRTNAGTAPWSTTVLVLQVDAMFVNAHAASNCAREREKVGARLGLHVKYCSVKKSVVGR